MVGRSFPLRRFMTESSGLVLAEMLLILPIMILVWAAVIEFGFLMYQWNQAVKAMQIGARLAAVSTPLADIGLLVPTGAAGDPIPSGAASVTCGAGVTACNVTELNRLVTGGDGTCGQTANGVIGVCDVAGFISASNLRITYHRSGLGYIGRPFGPVLTVTLEARDLNFDFLVLDNLIPGLASIAIPTHPVSITSEDLSDCDGACS